MSNSFAGLLASLKKQLIKITHAIEHQRVGVFGFDGEILLLHHQRVGGDGVDFNSVDVVFLHHGLINFFAKEYSCRSPDLSHARVLRFDSAVCHWPMKEREIRFSGLLHTDRGDAVLACARHRALTLDVIEGAGLAHILEVAGYLRDVGEMEPHHNAFTSAAHSFQ